MRSRIVAIENDVIESTAGFFSAKEAVLEEEDASENDKNLIKYIN